VCLLQIRCKMKRRRCRFWQRACTRSCMRRWESFASRKRASGDVCACVVFVCVQERWCFHAYACIHAYAISQYVTSYITLQHTHPISRYDPRILTRRHIHRADNTDTHTPTPNTHNHPAPIPTLTYTHTSDCCMCCVRIHRNKVCEHTPISNV